MVHYVVHLKRPDLKNAVIVSPKDALAARVHFILMLHRHMSSVWFLAAASASKRTGLG